MLFEDVPFGLIYWFAFSLIAIIAIVVGVLFDRKQRAERRRTHPPISDEEFVALCKPGTNPEIAIKVRHIIARNLNIPVEEIYPTDRFAEDLKAV